MSGVSASVLAGVLAALPKTGGRLGDHVFLFSGGTIFVMFESVFCELYGLTCAESAVLYCSALRQQGDLTPWCTCCAYSWVYNLCLEGT